MKAKEYLKKDNPGSKKHSDLYTDENPQRYNTWIKISTVKDAKASVSKIKSSGKTCTQNTAAVAQEQRAKVVKKSVLLCIEYSDQ